MWVNLTVVYDRFPQINKTVPPKKGHHLVYYPPTYCGVSWIFQHIRHKKFFSEKIVETSVFLFPASPITSSGVRIHRSEKNHLKRGQEPFCNGSRNIAGWYIKGLGVCFLEVVLVHNLRYITKPIRSMRLSYFWDPWYP